MKSKVEKTTAPAARPEALGDREAIASAMEDKFNWLLENKPYQSNVYYMRAILAEAIAPYFRQQQETVRELVEALRPHVAFVDELIGYWDFGGDVDGADMQDMLAKHGLLRVEPFDPAIHQDNSGAAEPGDDIYLPSNIARAILSRFPLQETDSIHADSSEHEVSRKSID